MKLHLDFHVKHLYICCTLFFDTDEEVQVDTVKTEPLEPTDDIVTTEGTYE